jgi:alcohol dehydrogenase (cytochrome c)
MYPVSRGVALFGDKIFFASNAAVLVALDWKTGKEVWTATMEDNKKGYNMSAAPVGADGKVVVGVSGGEWGTRRFVAAYELNTGKEVWLCFTIPAPGEPGSETWPAINGRRAAALPGFPETTIRVRICSTGVLVTAVLGFELRPGDNLYTSSTIAINAATGKIVGISSTIRTNRSTGTRCLHRY